MADIRYKRVFYYRVTPENYESGDSQTCTFRIPLTNELTSENIGHLLTDICACQPHMTPQEANQMAAQFQQQNPTLCHDLNEIDAFLEIMRGSDQMAQVQAKVALQALVDASQLDSKRLESGLLEIFKNCKDRITQSHVLDTLVAIKATTAAPEIIRQIDRNIRLHEYLSQDPSWRHIFIDFLFHGLARLQPPRLDKEIRPLLHHLDPVVLKGALWLVGQLRMRGFNDRLFELLNSPHQSVRDAAAKTIAALDQKETKSRLKTLINAPNTTAHLAAVIGALTDSKCFDAEEAVVKCLAHGAADVRAAAVQHLAASENAAHFDVLIIALADEEPEVRQQAAAGIARLSSVPPMDKEASLLRSLRDAFTAGKVPQAAAIMAELAQYAGEASRPTLVEIFRLADGRSINQTYFNENGDWRMVISINLKTQALGILSRGSVDDLVDEILLGLTHCDRDSLGSYLQVVAEKEIARAFDVLKGLSPQLIASNPMGVLSTALSLEPQDALTWAIDTLIQTGFTDIFLGFCAALEGHGVDLSVIPGFLARLRELFSVLENREIPGLYRLVRRYQVPEATSFIADDLRLTLGTAASERNIPVWEMYETLAVLPDSAGHERLLRHLAVCPPDHRLPILEYLAKYRPELARDELPRHLGDAEFVVREGAKRLIADLSTTPGNVGT